LRATWTNLHVGCHDMKVLYAPSFVRKYKNLPHSLQLEIREKIALFQHKENHQTLHVHKLRGKLKDQYSFRVNYKFRVVFIYTPEMPKTAILMAIGDHDVYNR